MPTKQPSTSWQRIRDYTEKFQWRDKRTGLMTTGYNPPVGAQDLSRVPFFIRYVTGKGRLEQGNAVCLKVDRRKHLRMIQFVTDPSLTHTSARASGRIPASGAQSRVPALPARSSNAIRFVRDYLIIEIDGTRFITH